MVERGTTMKDQSGKTVEGISVSVSETTERFSIIKLDDGTILRAKLSVNHAVRMDDLWDKDDNPVYIVNSQNIISVVESPESLKKNPPNASRSVQ